MSPAKVTMADIAREAGVSLALVSMAFRDAYGVSRPTKERILATAARMGYEPNRLASRLASKADPTLGVFLLDLHNEVFADMFDGMRTAAGAAGRDMVLTVGATAGELDRPSLDWLVRARVDVAIAAGLLLSDAELADYQRRLRLVSVARIVPGFDAVMSDNTLGARLAVQHVLELGHRRVAHLASPPTDGYLDRRTSYRDTMADAGLAPQIVTCGYSREAAQEQAGAMLAGDDRPTAIFAHNDQTALGVMDAAYLRGIRVPEELSVVGYDNTSASKPAVIGLTTVDLHAGDLGRRAVELAVHRSGDPDGERVVELTEPTLVVRTSTGPPPV